MLGFKITIIILVFYSLISSAVIKNTKTVFSCIVISVCLACSSVFVLAFAQEYQEPMAEAVTAAFENLQELILS